MCKKRSKDNPSDHQNARNSSHASGVLVPNRVAQVLLAGAAVLGLRELPAHVQVGVDAPLHELARLVDLDLRALVAGVPAWFLQRSFDLPQLLERFARKPLVAGDVGARTLAGDFPVGVLTAEALDGHGHVDQRGQREGTGDDASVGHLLRGLLVGEWR